VHLTLRQAELATGAGFVVLALLILGQSVGLGPGWDDSGPQPGFFPTALALLMALGGTAAFLTALRRRDPGPFFQASQEVVDLLKVGIPAALAIASVPYLGLYIMAVVYLGAFAAWYGGYRWYVTVPGAVLGAAALYWGLERAFRIPLPKSLWYGSGFPF
jgi:putative tricarboxylic transport membrane protein